MTTRWPWFCVATVLAGCPASPDDPVVDDAVDGWVLAETLPVRVRQVLALAGDGEAPIVSVINDRGEPELLRRNSSGSWAQLLAAPRSPARWLGTLDDSTLLWWAGPEGITASDPVRGTQSAPVVLPAPPLLASLNPRATPVPFDGHRVSDQTAWVAASGVLARTDDGGASWRSATPPASAGLNLLFSGVGGRGDTIVATAIIPAALLPDEFSGLLTGTVFLSEDAGNSWVSADPEGRFDSASDACVDAAGRVVLATLDQGVWRRERDGTWDSLGGPTDAVTVSCDRGLVTAGSATRGLWWTIDGTEWSTPAVVAPVTSGASSTAGIVDHGTRWAVDTLGRLYRAESSVAASGERAPAPGGATVHIALSHHLNLYHSYRGDSPTEDGYGKDLRIIGRTLDWLGEHPRVRADWDIENHFSLDGWMVTDPDGASLRARIVERVRDGSDGARLMSWNNGAMTHHTRSEFDAAISRAADSYSDAFGSTVWDRGVQPQENMFTPEHLGWYADAGIRWITLFWSSTPFNAMRTQLPDLPPAAAHSSFLLADPDDPSSTLEVVPVYHHGDLLDHGGLAGWARQLHQAHDGDRLLVIHFDADADSWENFDRELTEVEGLDFVRFTTIQDWLDTHEPAEEDGGPLTRTLLDTADGNGDGLQSWAEKNVNAEVFTDVVNGRRLAEAAALEADGNAAVLDAVDASFEDRLLALSTTHFGLAAPALHPDREAAARDLSSSSLSLAEDALDALPTPAATTVSWIDLEPRTEAHWVRATLTLPTSLGSTVGVRHEGAWLPVVVERDEPGPSQRRLEVSVRVPASVASGASLQWGAPGPAQAPSGSLTRAPELPPELNIPYTECDGVRANAQGMGADTTEVSADGLVARRTRTWAVSLCDATGTLTWTASAYDGLPGVVVEASFELGVASAPELAESVVFLPVVSPDQDTLDSITWRTWGGAVRTRPVPRGVGTWNGQGIHGWFRLGWTSGGALAVAIDPRLRTNMGPAPMRTRQGGVDTVALLGTLWSMPERHHSRFSGGHGYGDVGTAVIGSQFRPSAPDWTDAEGRMRVWLAPATVSDEALAVFGNPPVARVGVYAD